MNQSNTTVLSFLFIVSLVANLILLVALFGKYFVIVDQITPVSVHNTLDEPVTFSCWFPQSDRKLWTVKVPAKSSIQLSGVGVAHSREDLDLLKFPRETGFEFVGQRSQQKVSIEPSPSTAMLKFGFGGIRKEALEFVLTQDEIVVFNREKEPQSVWPDLQL